MHLTRNGPRERARADGIEALSDAELLAMMLGTGRKGEPATVLAASLLEEAGGLDGLEKRGLGHLASRAGVGPAKAARVAAGIALGRRAAAPSPPVRVQHGGDVHRWALPRIAALEHEELWVLALDGNSGLRAARRVAMGGLHGVHVTARDALRAAIREGASTFVLVHNHPSGDATPSEQDVDFTDRVAQAAEIVGTPLVDHVVVARDAYRSMLEMDILPRPWRAGQAGSPG